MLTSPTAYHTLDRSGSPLHPAFWGVRGDTDPSDFPPYRSEKLLAGPMLHLTNRWKELDNIVGDFDRTTTMAQSSAFWYALDKFRSGVEDMQSNLTGLKLLSLDFFTPALKDEPDDGKTWFQLYMAAQRGQVNTGTHSPGDEGEYEETQDGEEEGYSKTGDRDPSDNGFSVSQRAQIQNILSSRNLVEQCKVFETCIAETATQLLLHWNDLVTVSVVHLHLERESTEKNIQELKEGARSISQDIGSYHEADRVLLVEGDDNDDDEEEEYERITRKSKAARRGRLRKA